MNVLLTTFIIEQALRFLRCMQLEMCPAPAPAPVCHALSSSVRCCKTSKNSKCCITKEGPNTQKTQQKKTTTGWTAAEVIRGEGGG